jgi:hypothetical protein
MSVFIYPPIVLSTAGAATEANQVLILSELTDINTELDGQTTSLSSIATNTSDNATETTLAALNTKVTAVDTTGKATEAKQDDIITQVTAINSNTSDNATETTLAALNTKVTVVDTTGKSTEAKQDSTITELQAANTSLDNIEADIDALNARLAGALVPAEFDYIALTYVAAGNGTGEIETATYKTGGAAGTTQATLTLAYDAQDRLSSVTKA